MLFLNRLRQKTGAMMSLVVVLTGLFVLLGFGFVTLAQTISGDMQLIYATDAAALAAAQQIVNVSVSRTDLNDPKQFPSTKFVALVESNGVDSNGNISPSGIYNVQAYNIVAAGVLGRALQAASAAKKGDTSQLTNSIIELTSLHNYASHLDRAIFDASNPNNTSNTSPIISQAATALAQSNPTNNLPSLFGQSPPQVVSGSLVLGRYIDSSTTAGVHLPPGVLADPTIANWMIGYLASDGTLLANQPIDLTAITGESFTFTDSKNKTHKIVTTLWPVQPENTHTIVQSSFQPVQENGGDTAADAPVPLANAVQLQGTTAAQNTTQDSATSNSTGPQGGNGTSNIATLIASSAATVNTAIPSPTAPPPTTSTVATISKPPGQITESGPQQAQQPPNTISDPPTPPATPPATPPTPPPPPVYSTPISTVHADVHAQNTFSGGALSIGAYHTEPESGWSDLYVMTFMATSSFTINDNGTVIHIAKGTIFVMEAGAKNTAFLKASLPAQVLAQQTYAYDPSLTASEGQAAVSAAQQKYN